MSEPLEFWCRELCMDLDNEVVWQCKELCMDLEGVWPVSAQVGVIGVLCPTSLFHAFPTQTTLKIWGFSRLSQERPLRGGIFWSFSICIFSLPEAIGYTLSHYINPGQGLRRCHWDRWTTLSGLTAGCLRSTGVVPSAHTAHGVHESNHIIRQVCRVLLLWLLRNWVILLIFTVSLPAQWEMLVTAAGGWELQGKSQGWVWSLNLIIPPPNQHCGREFRTSGAQSHWEKLLTINSTQSSLSLHILLL